EGRILGQSYLAQRCSPVPDLHTCRRYGVGCRQGDPRVVGSGPLASLLATRPGNGDSPPRQLRRDIGARTLVAAPADFAVAARRSVAPVLVGTSGPARGCCLGEGTDEPLVDRAVVRLVGQPGRLVSSRSRPSRPVCTRRTTAPSDGACA